MKRIQVIDFLRGISILFMLFFHGSYYWDSLPSKNQMNLILANPFAGLALVLGKAAGIFALISGMSNAISMYSRMRSGKSKSLGVFLSGLVTGLWVILIGKIQVALFNHTMIGNAEFPYPDGPSEYSLIIGSIQTGQIQYPSVFTLIYKNTALFAIGLSIICTGIVLALLGMREGHKYVKRNLIVIGVLATTIICVTEPMKNLLRPIWYDAYINGQHSKGGLFSILIGDTYPFFPYIGYALYGAMFGIAFSQELDRKKVAIVGSTAGALYLTVGSILLAIYGHPDSSEIFQTLPTQWNFIQIGFFIWLSTFCYYFHYSPEKSKVRKALHSKFIRRFGLITLTIFVFEPLVGTTIKELILDKIAPGWSTNPIFAFIYGFALIMLWFVFLKLWEKVKFKGTLEWINGKITSFLTRRDASRLDIVRNLYGEDYVPKVRKKKRVEIDAE
ncbi:MAG: DUF1624 domain-containing protein [Asgard group archaeon]|nr:DUF1624 domain-containing protein [Asgard group archaeon]